MSTAPLPVWLRARSSTLRSRHAFRKSDAQSAWRLAADLLQIRTSARLILFSVKDHEYDNCWGGQGRCESIDTPLRQINPILTPRSADPFARAPRANHPPNSKRESNPVCATLVNHLSILHAWPRISHACSAKSMVRTKCARNRPETIRSRPPWARSGHTRTNSPHNGRHRA